MKVHRRTDFLGRECSDLGVGGSAVIRTLFRCVNPYKILDNPLGHASYLCNVNFVHASSTMKACQ